MITGLKLKCAIGVQLTYADRLPLWHKLEKELNQSSCERGLYYLPP